MKRIITIGLMLLMMCSMAFAQETETTTQQEQVRVNIMPDSPFYGLKLFFENIQEKLNSNTIQEHEQKRLIEIDAMILKGDAVATEKVRERVGERATEQVKEQVETKAKEGFIIDNMELEKIKAVLNARFSNKYQFMDGKVLISVDEKNYEVELTNDQISSITETFSQNGDYLATIQLSNTEMYGLKQMNVGQLTRLYMQTRNQNRIQLSQQLKNQNQGLVSVDVQGNVMKQQQGKQ